MDSSLFVILFCGLFLAIGILIVAWIVVDSIVINIREKREKAQYEANFKGCGQKLISLGFIDWQFSVVESADHDSGVRLEYKPTLAEKGRRLYYNVATDAESLFPDWRIIYFDGLSISDVAPGLLQATKGSNLRAAVIMYKDQPKKVMIKQY